MNKSIFIHDGKTRTQFKNSTEGFNYLRDHDIDFSKCTFYPSNNNKPDIYGSIKIFKTPKIQIKDRYKYLTKEEYHEVEVESDSIKYEQDELIDFENYSNYESESESEYSETELLNSWE